MRSKVRILFSPPSIVKGIMRLRTEIIAPYRTGKRWNIVKDAINYPVRLNFNLGNGTTYNIIFCRFMYDGLFVGIERVGCFTFFDNDLLHPEDVAEKLNLLYSEDASNITDWLHAQLGIEVEEFGRYEDALCIDRETEEES